MLEYEMFKEIVVKGFMNYMPEKYENYQVNLSKMQKINKAVDIMEIIPNETIKKTTGPVFYMDSLYESYIECGDLQTVFQKITKQAADAIEKSSDILEKMDYEKAAEQIIMTLVNTGQNKELLKNTPHRKWQDLSIVYRWLIDVGENAVGSILISDKLADNIGMDEETLFTAAVKNTQRLLPLKVESIGETAKRICLADGIPEEQIDYLLDTIAEKDFMYVISNGCGRFGASSILYENALHELANRTGSNLYLLPSSINEFIAVAALGDPNSLAQMVREINVYEVALEEQLSNQVYYYDKDLRKVSLATDTPYKQLESILKKDI